MKKYFYTCSGRDDKSQTAFCSLALTVLNLLLFADHQDAEGVFAAVAGDGGAGSGDEHLLEGMQLLNQGFGLVQDVLGNTGMGNEDPLHTDILPAFQTAPDVAEDGLFHGTPVFAAYLHFSVADFDLRPQLHQIGTKCRHTGAAASLVQKFQGLQHKTHIQLFRLFPQNSGNLTGIHSLFSQFL